MNPYNCLSNKPGQHQTTARFRGCSYATGLHTRMILLIVTFFMPVASFCHASPSWPGNEYHFKATYKVGLLAEQLPDWADDRGQEREQGGFLDISLAGSTWLDDNWYFLAEGRGILAGSNLTTSFDDLDGERSLRTTDSNSYLQLRQLLLQYHGLTDYPGESLTFGLQRVRSTNSLWWDSDIESLIWRFSGTRLRIQAGIGEQLNSYRTGHSLLITDRDKLRFFTETMYDWRAYHAITFRSMYSRQHSNEAPRDIYTSAPEGLNGDWLWYGFGASSNWTKRRNSTGTLAYHLEWTGLSGQSDFLGDDGTILKDHAIHAWAFDAGLRYDFQTQSSSVGLTFSFGSGGFDKNESNLFVQTGLQSNRERYMGNSQFMSRFNDALRPDLTNLIHESLFASHTFQETVLLAGALSWFQRDDSDLPIYRSSTPLKMNSVSSEVGCGADISLRYDVNTSLFTLPVTFIRLRGSTFFPGNAFDDDADDTVYRVVLEIFGKWGQKK